MVRATHGVSSGSWYYEVTVKPPQGGEDGHVRLGWCTEMGDVQARAVTYTRDTPLHLTFRLTVHLPLQPPLHLPLRPPPLDQLRRYTGWLHHRSNGHYYSLARRPSVTTRTRTRTAT